MGYSDKKPLSPAARQVQNASLKLQQHSAKLAAQLRELEREEMEIVRAQQVHQSQKQLPSQQQAPPKPRPIPQPAGKEERWLREMFQAVFPDLGSFRSWGTATKVASMSTSLSLSLAFFGAVWYMSKGYERAQNPPEEHRAREA
ncbi:hypothetical protein DUNSADRAFT_1281 [Dunaliella salina]|uniref:Uncharacterized protein n=1 Tax=Dunaliella salina TaxID=3046 RepID=A0ABQ7GXF1_DUNSA|nr:hypothetical protein DUNSADRAFT_1281 [Dunaliella salina]|eukprot:KAF5839247.1 hypothetical protein DUNSADRAFT_1281 [Dunaliella salina]